MAEVNGEGSVTSNSKSGGLIKFLIAILLLGSWGGAAYLYNQNRNLSVELADITSDPNLVAQKEVSDLVKKVSELVVLPEDEVPVVATVEDKEKLTGQEFFKNAENGDKVLIYARSRKVYLYDPEGHKILEVAPLNIGTTGIEEIEARIVIANGSGEGSTANAEAAIVKLMPNAKIVARISTSSTDYEGVVVIDLTGENKLLAFQMARALEVEAVDLPEGETVEVEADILIIVGK